MARIAATPAARSAIAALRAAGTPVMFVQSAGCCAGSTPMCYPDGEFLVGDGDVCLGDVDGAPFYIDARLDAALRSPSLLLDVADGPPEGFSLPAGAGRHFIARDQHAEEPPSSGLLAASSWCPDTHDPSTSSHLTEAVP